MSGITAEEIYDFFRERYPEDSLPFCIESLGSMQARVRLPVDASHLRPGGTVSGPSMMKLADAAMYFAILGELGPVFDAVTSNLNISFLRRPNPVDVIAEVSLLKLGRRLAFGDIKMFSHGESEPVAHATCTYAIPYNEPKREAP